MNGRTNLSNFSSDPSGGASVYQASAIARRSAFVSTEPVANEEQPNVGTVDIASDERSTEESAEREATQSSSAETDNNTDAENEYAEVLEQFNTASDKKGDFVYTGKIEKISLNGVGDSLLQDWEKINGLFLGKLRQLCGLSPDNAINFNEVLRLTLAPFLELLRVQMNKCLPRGQTIGWTEMLDFAWTIIFMKKFDVSYGRWKKDFVLKQVPPKVGQKRFSALISALNKKSVTIDEDPNVPFRQLYDDSFITKIEKNICEIFSPLRCSGLERLVIDDDKLEKVCKAFIDANITTSGFRDCSQGPTMHGIGDALTMVIYGVRFARKGEGTLKVIQLLLKWLFKCEDKDDLHRFVKAVQMFGDRGYIDQETVNWLLKMGVRFGGTVQVDAGVGYRTEKSKAKMPDGGKFKSSKGIKCSEVSKEERKVDSAKHDVFTVFNRSGTGRAGILQTNMKDLAKSYDATMVSQAGFSPWSEEQALRNGEKEFRKHYKGPLQADILSKVQQVYETFSSKIIELTTVQARPSWFCMRIGHITGTAGGSLLRKMKHELVDSVPESAASVFEYLNVQLIKPTDEDISKLTVRGLMLAVKRLNKLDKKYALKDHTLFDEKHKDFKGLDSSTKRANKRIVTEWQRIVKEDLPKEEAFYECLFSKWAMPPNKVKTTLIPDGTTKDIVDHRAVGKKVEPEIRARMPKHLKRESKGVMEVMWSKEYGLLTQPSKCQGLAVSPDAVSIVRMVIPSEASELEKLPHPLMTDLGAFFQNCPRLGLDPSAPMTFLTCEEYKTKTSSDTEKQALEILNELQHPLRILPFNADLCKRAVGQYKDQILHQCAVTGAQMVLFVVASTSAITYCVLVYFSEELVKEYITLHKYLRDKYLYWMYEKKNGIQEFKTFDKELSRMPSFNNVDFAYMKDRETLLTLLLIMFLLLDIVKFARRPLPDLDKIEPTLVILWNLIKGVIDDFTFITEPFQGKFFGNNANGITALRGLDIILSNSHRILQQIGMEKYASAKSLKSWKEMIDKRKKLEHCFVDTLDYILGNMHDALSLFKGPDPREGVQSEQMFENEFSETARLDLHRKTSRETWEKSDYVNFRLNCTYEHKLESSGQNFLYSLKDRHEQCLSAKELASLKIGFAGKRKNPKGGCKVCHTRRKVVDNDGNFVMDENDKHKWVVSCSQIRSMCNRCGVFLHNTVQKGFTKSCWEIFHNDQSLPKLKTTISIDEYNQRKSENELAGPNGRRKRPRSEE